MELKTYRAATMHEALALVRRDLGPDAAVLHTREVPHNRLLSWLTGARQIEVTASVQVNVPSRLPAEPAESDPPPRREPSRGRPKDTGIRLDAPPGVQGQLNELQSMVRELCRQSRGDRPRELPDSLFRLFAELLDADVSEDLARDLVERVRAEAPDAEQHDPVLLRARVLRMVEADVAVAGPIGVTRGQRRLVALVGPTGVGKTTTIAKLAAHYRLKEKRRVGLITVDTYRIAAVEQLRTYADIIDLPMQVVSTPREMREATRQLDDMDLVLMDTAGRSPRDEIKIQELKAFLTEARADEVHLVLSSGTGARALVQTAQQFAAVGTTALVLTKLDEAPALGNLLPMVHGGRLPVSYLTNGQNVPDDIETAERGRLARLILGMDPAQDK